MSRDFVTLHKESNLWKTAQGLHGYAAELFQINKIDKQRFLRQHLQLNFTYILSAV
jgi:hypothetical protein